MNNWRQILSWKPIDEDMPHVGDRYYIIKHGEGNTFLVLYVGLWRQAPADIQSLDIETGIAQAPRNPPENAPIVIIKSSNGYQNFWYTLAYFLEGYKGLKAN